MKIQTITNRRVPGTGRNNNIHEHEEKGHKSMGAWEHGSIRAWEPEQNEQAQLLEVNFR